MHTYQYVHSTCGACLEVVFEFWTKSTLIRFFDGKTRFSTSWHVEMSLTLNEPLKNVPCQTSTLPPSMHWKLTEHGQVLYAKQPTPDQKSCWVKRMTPIYKIYGYSCLVLCRGAEEARARAARLRLQRGIWTSTNFGDLRRALAGELSWFRYLILHFPLQWLLQIP